ncbi:hypothetical protein ACDY96_16655 [Rhizobium mongolense]|uniref:hypothetical protein n=1 Tax=Rhizobium TaxID=379 RepID=UPI0024B0F2F6|nr:hypothetical protein [Rhizobium sp. CC1099]WFU88864.1 hypothetical protein QA644_07360 [Rhizobium sp. CC1099]
MKETSLAAFESRSEIPADDFFSKSELNQATAALRQLAARLVDLAEGNPDDVSCSFETMPDGTGRFNFRAFRRAAS